MDATPIDQLIAPGGAQQPAMSLPAATTYPQMITPGTSSAIYTPPMPTAPPASPVVVRSVLKNILMYVSIFVAVVIVSMTAVQSMVLRYVPGSYSGSGVVSLTGAGVLGALGVFLVYVLQVLLAPMI